VPEDGKVILVYCTHYSKSISPFLREADYVILTSIKKVHIQKFPKDSELGMFFRKPELISFYYVCTQIRNATPENPYYYVSGKKWDAREYRSVLVSGDLLYSIVTVPKQPPFEHMYYYRPKPPELILERLGEKMGPAYTEEVKRVLTEARAVYDG
jgi:hypothetical protein